MGAKILLAGLLGAAGAMGCGVEASTPDASDPSCVGAKCDDADDDQAVDIAELTTCVDRPEEAAIRDAVVTLLEGLSSGESTEITSVADFVAALPDAARSNLLFLTHSRALARVNTAQERRRLLLDTRASDARTIDPDAEGHRWCVDGEDGESTCVESRVLVMSPDADFIGSFTTHPDSPSEGHFELSIFDPIQSEVTLFDVDFSRSEPRVTKNPSRCMACHQGGNGDINFRMDPYRFWAYATPFNEDYVRADSVEAQWYLSLLRRIEAGAEPALAALRPRNDLATVQASIERGEDRQLTAPDSDVDFSGVDSPALNLSHQLLEKNGCRTAKALTQRPDFDTIKYAAVGALIDCGDIEAFLPDSASEDAHTYFVRRNEGVADGRFDFATLAEQTHGMQTRLLSDKLSRRFDHLSEFVGPQRAWTELEGALAQTAFGGATGYGVSNFETYGSQVAKARFVLEPLGVDVAQWSMAVDREHHSHVEFLFPVAMQPVFIDLLQREFELDALTGRTFDPHGCNNLGTTGGGQSAASGCRAAIEAVRPQLCPQLAERSREVLADHEVDIAALFSEGPRDTVAQLWMAEVDDAASLEDEARQVAAAVQLDTLREQAAAIYDDNCRTCHVKGYRKGRPLLPFDDIAQMETVFSRHRNVLEQELHGDQLGQDTRAGRYEFEYISHADRIWERVTRHPLQHGAMPFDEEPLSHDDKVTLRAHMIAVDAAGH